MLFSSKHFIEVKVLLLYLLIWLLLFIFQIHYGFLG